LDVWNVLLDHEWVNARPQPLPDEVSLLFGHFIHDQVVQSTAQRTAKSLGGQRYFDTRGFDMKAATCCGKQKASDVEDLAAIRGGLTYHHRRALSATHRYHRAEA